MINDCKKYLNALYAIKIIKIIDGYCILIGDKI